MTEKTIKSFYKITLYTFILLVLSIITIMIYSNMEFLIKQKEAFRYSIYVIIFIGYILIPIEIIRINKDIGNNLYMSYEVKESISTNRKQLYKIYIIAVVLFIISRLQFNQYEDTYNLIRGTQEYKYLSSVSMRPLVVILASSVQVINCVFERRKIYEVYICIIFTLIGVWIIF